MWKGWNARSVTAMLTSMRTSASVFHPNNHNIHLASGYSVFRDIIRSIAGPASRYGRIWYIFVLQNQLQEISFIFFPWIVMSSSIIWFFLVESFQCASDFKLLRFDDPISLQGRHFRFCLRGPTAQSSLNLLLPSTPPKNDFISGCRPLCRQIFDDLSFFLIIHSILIFLTFDSLKGNAPSLLTQDQMAPLSSGENWFRTWAVAIMQPNQKLPHVTH